MSLHTCGFFYSLLGAKSPEVMNVKLFKLRAREERRECIENAEYWGDTHLMMR